MKIDPREYYGEGFIPPVGSAPRGLGFSPEELKTPDGRPVLMSRVQVAEEIAVEKRRARAHLSR